MRSILDVLYNFHWIAPGEAARAAQAYIGFLGPLLKRHDIRAVINLRGANPGHGWWRYETRVCARRGVMHSDVKLNSRQLPTRAMLLDLIDAFASMPRPFPPHRWRRLGPREGRGQHQPRARLIRARRLNGLCRGRKAAGR